MKTLIIMVLCSVYSVSFAETSTADLNDSIVLSPNHFKINVKIYDNDLIEKNKKLICFNRRIGEPLKLNPNSNADFMSMGFYKNFPSQAQRISLVGQAGRIYRKIEDGQLSNKELRQLVGSKYLSDSLFEEVINGKNKRQTVSKLVKYLNNKNVRENENIRFGKEKTFSSYNSVDYNLNKPVIERILCRDKDNKVYHTFFKNFPEHPKAFFAISDEEMKKCDTAKDDLKTIGKDYYPDSRCRAKKPSHETIRLHGIIKEKLKNDNKYSYVEDQLIRLPKSIKKHICIKNAKFVGDGIKFSSSGSQRGQTVHQGLIQIKCPNIGKQFSFLPFKVEKSLPKEFLYNSDNVVDGSQNYKTDGQLRNLVLALPEDI